MKIMMSSVLVALLSACGGGGGSENAIAPAATAPPVAAPPVASPPDATPPASRTREVVPPLSLRAILFTSPSVSVKSDSLFMLIRSPEKANLVLVGNGNNLWISEGQVMGQISITGTSNMLVMMDGSTVTSLVVSAGNTVYLPFHSTIVVGGTGATVKYY